MKEELLFLGIVFSLALIFYIFFSIIKRFVSAVRKKDLKGAAIEVVILLVEVVLCALVLKPFRLVEYLVEMLK